MIEFEEILFLVFLILGGLHLLPVLVRSISILSPKHSVDTSNCPEVSIVICARNELENLQELLPLLLAQDYPSFEIRVILDRCSDKSLDYMKSLEKKYSHLTTIIVDEIPDHFHPKKYGLTLGIKGASHDWVLLTDADCRPNSDQWIRSFGNRMNNEREILIGYSPYVREKGFLNHFIQFETFITAFNYFSAAALGRPYMGVGRNIAYRKKLFLDAKGFNEFQGVSGGDDDLFVQYQATGKNTASVICADSIVYSKAKKNVRDYFIQKRRHLSVGKYYKNSIVLTHVVRVNIHLMLWVCFIILAFLNYQMIWILPTMVGIIAAKGILFWITSKKFGHGYPYWMTPILDSSYALFLPIIGTISFFTKNIKWK